MDADMDHLLIYICWLFAHACLLGFILIGWWRFGYRDGGARGFIPNPRRRGVFSIIFGVGIIAVMIVIQWKHELQSIGSSQATNNAAVGIGFIYFFPWIYLTVLGFCRELQKKLQKTI